MRRVKQKSLATKTWYVVVVELKRKTPNQEKKSHIGVRKGKKNQDKESNKPKSKVFKNLYISLHKTNEKRDICKVAKARQRKTKNLSLSEVQVKKIINKSTTLGHIRDGTNMSQNFNK